RTSWAIEASSAGAASRTRSAPASSSGSAALRLRFGGLSIADLLQAARADDRSIAAAMDDRDGGLAAAGEDGVAAGAHRVEVHHQLLPSDDRVAVGGRPRALADPAAGEAALRGLPSAGRAARDVGGVGDDVLDQIERVVEDVADQVRDRHAERGGALLEL